MISKIILASLSLFLDIVSRTAAAQCGDKCGLYGGLASVATLNFNLEDCELEHTWLKLDCTVDSSLGSLWNIYSFTDENDVCSYEKPINIERSTYACSDHLNWDIAWTNRETCSGTYSWEKDVYAAFPSGGCNPFMGPCGFDILHDMETTSGSFHNTKLLCNSGDYLALLSQTSDTKYMLIFKTTYYDGGFSDSIPRQEGDYCTSIWEIILRLRTQLKVDGTYESLPSACGRADWAFGFNTAVSFGLNTAVASALVLTAMRLMSI